jgi:hypothetical protein
LTKDELIFIYQYPDIAAKVMTVSPYYEPKTEAKGEMANNSTNAN